MWLSGPTLDVCLEDNRFPRISDAPRDEDRDDVAAHLQRSGDTYEIAAPGLRPLWVNGERIEVRTLRDRDLVEFGEKGPLSRFRIYRDDQPPRKPASDILSDLLTYLRVSRRPVASRIVLATTGVIARLTRETTLIFRISVVLALAGLAVFAYQQSRLNSLLQQQIETDASRIEDFAASLARARDEALTPGDLTALRNEFGPRLVSAAERLEALEQRTQASARVIAGSASSVVFLQGSYGFRERSSGRMMRHAVDREGNPLLSPRGQPLLSLDGTGPVAERQFSGTGFAVDDGGTLVTNRHVAVPWENDANVKAMATQDLEPVMLRFIAYAPGNQIAGTVELLRVSEDADLAILRVSETAPPMPRLELADQPPRPGDEVIVMGYPTGLRSMLAQSGGPFLAELQEAGDTGFFSVAAKLAERGLIAPLASRGIVGQVTLSAVVYDAETTHGGSGGPVLDTNGAVVAVNTAILPEFGGSNLGIPVERVRALLKIADISQ